MKTFLVLVLSAGVGSVVAQPIFPDGESRQSGYSVPGVGEGEAADPVERGEGPKIRMPVANAFEPYRVVAECPRGTVVKVEDWPEKGDLGCVPSEDPKAREARPSAAQGPSIQIRTRDVAKPYKDIDYCPRGSYPVIYDQPKRGDMLCDRNHRIKDWEMVPQGEGPRISLAVDDPFQPYKQVGTCPPDKNPVLVDWPKPGDMICQ